MRALAALLLIAAAASAQQQPRPASWRDTLNSRLSLFGHRNWIVIADAAYPLHSGPGIETIDSDADEISTIRSVLIAIRRTHNLRPVVYLDSELSQVPEADAPGITGFRQELLSFVKDALSAPHDRLIARIDEAGRNFSVLVVKTNMVLPYTSVFIELRASYWSDEAEQRLRQSIRP
jgi:hypothetical protein